MCFANRHQQWNPSPCGGKACTEVMHVRLCPEQLRQVGRQTQGMAAAIHCLPAFGLSSACACLGPEVLTAPTVPAQPPGFPCTLPMARTPHQPPGSVGLCPTNVTVGLVSSSPAWSWSPTKLGLPTCAWCGLSSSPESAWCQGLGLPWCPALPYSWLVQSAKDGPGSALPPQWNPCGPSLFLTESKWHQGQDF